MTSFSTALPGSVTFTYKLLSQMRPKSTFGLQFELAKTRRPDASLPCLSRLWGLGTTACSSRNGIGYQAAMWQRIPRHRESLQFAETFHRFGHCTGTCHPPCKYTLHLWRDRYIKLLCSDSQCESICEGTILPIRSKSFQEQRQYMTFPARPLSRVSVCHLFLHLP